MKRNLIFLVPLIVILGVIWGVQQKSNINLVVGTANPGRIIFYEQKNNSFQKGKVIDTNYSYVWTVRVGEIFNDGKKYVVAGVSNSFYKQPYGCKVIAYDLERFSKIEIDSLGDLRCKDITIGDADNDGFEDILLVTHGEGSVKKYSWKKDNWDKEEIDNNFIDQVDKKEKTSHRVPNNQLPCNMCIIQTAIHIVEIVDLDKDGKNEILTTISSPLELQNPQIAELSFLIKYKKVKDKWERSIIDRHEGTEFRGIAAGNIYNTDQEAIVIGLGSARNEKGSVLAYHQTNSGWKKTMVYTDPKEKNLKSVEIGDILSNGTQQILIATGFPDSEILAAEWKEGKFNIKELGKVSTILKMPGAEYNSMAVIHAGKNIINGGFMTFPLEKKGAEMSNSGFLIDYKFINNSWIPEVIGKESIWAMELY